MKLIPIKFQPYAKCFCCGVSNTKYDTPVKFQLRIKYPQMYSPNYPDFDPDFQPEIRTNLIFICRHCLSEAINEHKYIS